MTTKMSASKRDRDDDDLDEMREAFRRHQEREKRGGSGGGGNDWDKLGDGKNKRRVLPRPKHRKFYTEGWTHFNVGPNDRAVRCIDEESIDLEKGLPKSGTKCPLCRRFLKEQDEVNSRYAKGDKEGHKEWKEAKDKWAARHQYYANVLRSDEDEDDPSFEVKILAFGQQVWSQLMNYYVGDDSDVGDFTKVNNGRWLNIKKTKKGGRDRRNVGYEVFAIGDPDDLSDAWDDIKAMLHDLDAACGKLYTKDEVVKIMKGITDKESDDDDADDRKSKKSRRSRDEDEGEDDGEEESEDEPEEKEEEEEDERPKNRKGGLSDKMKRRRESD